MTSAILVNVVHLPDTLGARVEEEEGDCSLCCFQATDSEVVIGLNASKVNKFDLVKSVQIRPAA